MFKKVHVWQIGIIVALVLIISVSIGYLIATNPNTSDGSPWAPVLAGFLFDSPPALDQTATLTFRMLPHLGGEGTGVFSVRIVLPEGLTWVSGGSSAEIFDNFLIENVNLTDNVMSEVQGTIKVVETGRWDIMGFVTPAVDAPENMTFEDMVTFGYDVEGGARITLIVFENSAQVERFPSPWDNIIYGDNV